MADGKTTVFDGTFQEWSNAQREEESAAAAVRLEEREKPAQRPHPARSVGPKRRNPAAPVIDMEQVIVALEDRLKGIETQLQEATLSQDFKEMSRLGEEHIKTQSELEQRLKEWEA